MADGVDLDRVERLLADQLRHRIRQLDFAAGPRLAFVEDAHHVRLKDIAADHGKIGRSGFGLGLFDQAEHFRDGAVLLAGSDYTIAVGAFPRHFLGGEHVAAIAVPGIDHLLERAGCAGHQVVGKQHRERLVADDLASAPDSVAETERLLLPDRDELAEAGARRLQRIEAFALLPHRGFELEGGIEIIDQRRLSAAGDEDQLLDPRLARFVDRILDQRPVDDRQQLLRDRLGGGQKSGAEARDWKNGLAELRH